MFAVIPNLTLYDKGCVENTAKNVFSAALGGKDRTVVSPSVTDRNINKMERKRLSRKVSKTS